MGGQKGGSKRAPPGGVPGGVLSQGAVLARIRPDPKKCPHLSRLGELLNTLENVHFSAPRPRGGLRAGQRGPPWGPPGRGPPGPPWTPPPGAGGGSGRGSRPLLSLPRGPGESGHPDTRDRPVLSARAGRPGSGRTGSAPDRERSETSPSRGAHVQRNQDGVSSRLPLRADVPSVLASDMVRPPGGLGDQRAARAEGVASARRDRSAHWSWRTACHA